VADTERASHLNVAQPIHQCLARRVQPAVCRENLKDFQQTVAISQQRYKAGDISEGDYLKIKLNCFSSRRT